MTGEVIDPIKLHWDSGGEAGPTIAQASYIFQLGNWKRRYRIAKEKEDWATMDQMDREYEMLGLP